MPTFRPADIVKVPFPYTDRSTRQRRPALVVVAGDLAEAHGLLWVLMITSAENRAWPGDVTLDFRSAGLPAASVVRTAKIATIEVSSAEVLGRVSEAEFRKVRSRMSEALKD